MAFRGLICHIRARWDRKVVLGDPGARWDRKVVLGDPVARWDRKVDRQRHRHRRIFYIFTCYDDGGVLMVVVMVPYANFRAFTSKCDQLDSRSDI